MEFFRAIDLLVWDDRFEQFRRVAAWSVVIVAAIYFGHALLATPVH